MAKKPGGLQLISVGLSLILAIGVMTAFAACGRKEDGTWMHCHSVQTAVFLCGLVLAVLFVLAAWSRNRAVRISLNAAAAVLAVVTCLLPGTLMPMCMMQTMRCYMVMQPFVRIVSIFSAVCAAVGVFRSARNGRISAGK